MGTFSKFNRFREAGEEANVNNVQRFGTPARSLFTSTKVFTLHHHIDITNEADEVVYTADTKAITLRDKTDIVNSAGILTAHIEKKIFTLHERHFITMADGKSFQLATELFHVVKDVLNIKELGWQLRGNVFGLNFQLYDGDGSVIAVISQKMMSLHDKYCVDIYKPEYEPEIVALLVTLQHMIHDREAAASSSSN